MTASAASTTTTTLFGTATSPAVTVATVAPIPTVNENMLIFLGMLLALLGVRGRFRVAPAGH